jgi:hypothetical protein
LLSVRSCYSLLNRGHSNSHARNFRGYLWKIDENYYNGDEIRANNQDTRDKIQREEEKSNYKHQTTKQIQNPNIKNQNDFFAGTWDFVVALKFVV